MPTQPASANAGTSSTEAKLFRYPWAPYCWSPEVPEPFAMPLLSAALLLAFLVVVFPLRSLRRRVQFGSAGRAAYSRKRPPAWWLADLLFLAGFGVVLASPVLLVATDTMLLFDPEPAISATVTVGVLLATCLSVWSQETMGAAWRPDIGPADHAALVTSGPFRYVRNPNYVAMMAAALCATLLTPTLTGFAGVLVLPAGLALTASAEERRLLRGYGNSYRQ